MHCRKRSVFRNRSATSKPLDKKVPSRHLLDGRDKETRLPCIGADSITSRPSSPYTALSRARVFASPTPADLDLDEKGTAFPRGNPTPLSMTSSNTPFVKATATIGRLRFPALGPSPCFKAFSTSGWSSDSGTLIWPSMAV
jgi:hypothetical protein